MSFDFKFKILRKTRSNFESLVKNSSEVELNKIPDGFSNNIIWNFGHSIAVQQALIYGLSSLPLIADEHFMMKFKKGSKPEKECNSEEIKSILDLSKVTMEAMEKDFNKDRFKTYQKYQTSFGLELSSVEDALTFLPVHEGLHLGYAMAIRKANSRNQ